MSFIFVAVVAALVVVDVLEDLKNDVVKVT
jgi:hypothetical protein